MCVFHGKHVQMFELCPKHLEEFQRRRVNRLMSSGVAWSHYSDCKTPQTMWCLWLLALLAHTAHAVRVNGTLRIVDSYPTTRGLRLYVRTFSQPPVQYTL